MQGGIVADAAQCCYCGDMNRPDPAVLDAKRKATWDSAHAAYKRKTTEALAKLRDAVRGIPCLTQGCNNRRERPERPEWDMRCASCRQRLLRQERRTAEGGEARVVAAPLPKRKRLTNDDLEAMRLYGEDAVPAPSRTRGDDVVSARLSDKGKRRAQG